MKFRSPWVPRWVYETAVTRADAEHENAMVLRHTLAGERQRFDELLARYHEANSRIAGIAEQMTAPRPIAAASSPAPEFGEFPPAVAAALAVATAGFRKDQKREIYGWAASQLADNVAPEEVAATLKNGLPVTIDPDELQ